MTDTDQLVVWLREAMEAAQADAEAATPGPWVVRGLGRHDQAAILQGTGARSPAGFAVGPAFMDAQGSRATADARHAAHHHPAAVLRRIAADRKTLARHQPREVVYGIGPVGRILACSYDPHLWPCPDIIDLAEGWGWTEETP